MTQAWLVGNRRPVPQDATAVRTTIEPVRTDGPSESNEEPRWNEFDADNSPQLVGLTPRQKSGDVNESAQYVPFWIALAQQDFESRIDDQVSSSGTAAKREAAGSQGHGTMEYTKSIEPVIREGGFYGNDYFTVNPLGSQEGAGNYMSADATMDNDWLGVAQATGVRASRAAYDSTLYGQWLENGLG